LRVGGDEVDERSGESSDLMDTSDLGHHRLAGALPAGAVIAWPGLADPSDGDRP
jgi:hypothetical protein